MALDIDGAAVLSAATQATDLFPTVRADSSKLAKALVTKAIKSAAAKPDAMRRIRGTIGVDAFAIVLDSLTGPALKGLLGKLDKHNSAIKMADSAEQRRRIIEIAGGAEPSQPELKPKLARSTKGEKPSKPAVERGFSSKAAQAKRKT